MRADVEFVDVDGESLILPPYERRPGRVVAVELVPASNDPEDVDDVDVVRIFVELGGEP